MKFKIFSILLALSVMTFASSPPIDNLLGGVVRWVKIEIKANKTKLILAGKEYHGGTTNYDVYAGRINHAGGIIPGKYVVHDNGWLYYTNNQVKFRNQTNFELLQYLPGTLSWISSSSGAPVDAVVAGHNPSTQESLYLCRGMKDGNLVVGKYLDSSKSCFVEFLSREYIVDVFEILALNSLGRLLIEKEGKNSRSSITSKILTFDGKPIEVGCPQNGTTSSVNIYNSHVKFN